VQFAAAIYLAMVVITFSTLFGIGGGLRRFARQAQEIREQRRRTGSFSARNEIPELADVAAEFDRMVDALNRSAAAIRRAAEDNAHAFKTPIAVIRQSLEPLRRALPPENQRVQRAIDSIDRSLDRLDGLVASARRLDEATADLVAEPRRSIDLPRLLGKLIDSRGALLPGRDIRLRGELSPGIFVLGSEEMIETVLENLIDNAASYSPAGSESWCGSGRSATPRILRSSTAGPACRRRSSIRFSTAISRRAGAAGKPMRHRVSSGSGCRSRGAMSRQCKAR
jgi:two-component system sensor histidine kinase ChvG